MDVRIEDEAGGAGLPESRPDAAPRPSRGLRFRLTTLLVLVAAVASATALYAAWAEVNPDPDTPITMLLTVVLTGLAVGALRRASPTRVMVQIALACAALRLAVEVDETRLGKYTFQALFAATIVVPLFIIRALEASGREGRRRDWVAAVAAVLFNTGLNLAAHVAFLVVENESNMMPVRITAPSSSTLVVPMPPGPPMTAMPPGVFPGLPPGIEPTDAPPLMPDEPQLVPNEPGSDPVSTPPEILAPPPGPGPKLK